MHSKKRRFMAHAFSSSNLQHFEPIVQSHLRTLASQLDRIADQGATIKGGQTVNMLTWFNYFTFDTIADLSFGKSLDMLKNGSDVTEFSRGPDAELEYFSTIEIMEQRAVLTLALATMPVLLKIIPWVPSPTVKTRNENTKKLNWMAAFNVRQRIDNPPDVDRMDILARLIEARDDQGTALTFDELLAEARLLLVAGSDTTANTLAQVVYDMSCHAEIMAKLQNEIDGTVPEDADVPAYAMVRDLPYLDMVLKESMRLHSMVGVGLPRRVPENSNGGITLCGQFFPSGTVLSVSSYNLHYSEEIWGPDVREYRPERWEKPTSSMKAAFAPFSVGARACVGRNLAEMELKMATALWVRRYTIQRRQDRMLYSESFIRRPESAIVGLKRRGKEYS